jgi:uncharacterized protein
VIHPLDHLVVLALAVLFPIRAATVGYRRLRDAPEEEVPRRRLTLYRQIIRAQWLLVLLVVAVWIWQGRAWSDLGLVARPTVGMFYALGIIAVLVTAAWLQWLKHRNSDEAWARVLARVARFKRIMPHTAEDLRWFSAVSVTAGICEEFLYRAYLLWYLGHWLGPLAAVIVASVIFGAGHFYQGPPGMARTGVVGAIMAGIYRLSGSIFPGMLLHVLIDLYSGRMVYEANRLAPASPDRAAPHPATAAPPAAPAA